MRIVSFVDGFTSASAPSTSEAGQEEYSLTNNQASFANVTDLSLTGLASASGFMEIERIGSSTYRQIIHLNFIYNGSDWSLAPGAYSGDNLLQESSITSSEQIALTVTGSQVQYKTGNLSGHTSSKIKLWLTRFQL